MRRLPQTPRPNWSAEVEKVGLTFHTHSEGGTARPYWNESACYEFSADEVDQVEGVINELHHLLIDVAETVVTKGEWDRVGIPDGAVPLVQRSWEADDFSLYGRFDFAWMPGSQPRLLEYNADTPTALVEAAVAQWYWLQAKYPQRDQFNSIHERLVEAWKQFGKTSAGLKVIDFVSVSENLEDEQTVSYLMDTAQQAGFRTRWSDVEKIGYDNMRQTFVSAAENSDGGGTMVSCFKLYPWEWLFREAFGKNLDRAATTWIEPPWKSLLSNKGILALAWEKFPGHPNLLPCYFESGPLNQNFVRKPKLSREGANITWVENGEVRAETGGDYGQDGFVYQQPADIPNFSGNHPIIGGWVVDHEAAGLGVREADGLITDNFSRFVPHFFVPR